MSNQKPYYDHSHLFSKLKAKNESFWNKNQNDLNHLFGVSLFTMFVTQPKGRLIDLGCGTGEDAIALERLGYSVDAVEYSSVGLEICRANALKFDSKVNFVQGNILNLKGFTDQSFDIIYSSAVLHCFSDESDRMDFFSEINRLLKPSGEIFLSTLCELPKEDVLKKMKIDLQTGVAEGKFRTFKTRKQLENEYARAGLKIFGQVYYEIEREGDLSKECFYYLKKH